MVILDTICGTVELMMVIVILDTIHHEEEFNTYHLMLAISQRYIMALDQCL